MSQDWTVEDFQELTPGGPAGLVLGAVNPEALPGPVRVAFVAAVQRQRNHYDAVLMAAAVSVVDALDAPRFVEPPAGDRWGGREVPRDLAADEVAAALAWTTDTAGGLVDLAV